MEKESIKLVKKYGKKGVEVSFLDTHICQRVLLNKENSIKALKRFTECVETFYE